MSQESSQSLKIHWVLLTSCINPVAQTTTEQQKSTLPPGLQGGSGAILDAWEKHLAEFKNFIDKLPPETPASHISMGSKSWLFHFQSSSLRNDLEKAKEEGPHVWALWCHPSVRSRRNSWILTSPWPIPPSQERTKLPGTVQEGLKFPIVGTVFIGYRWLSLYVKAKESIHLKSATLHVQLIILVEMSSKWLETGVYQLD